MRRTLSAAPRYYRLADASREVRLLINERLRKYMQRSGHYTYSAAYPTFRRSQLSAYAGEGQAEADSDEADAEQQSEGERQEVEEPRARRSRPTRFALHTARTSSG